MALPSKLFRFKIELSDLEKASYQSLDFRVAQHPSETLTYMLTRVLAYALSFEEGLEFSAGGLSDPDAPCLRSTSPMGSIKLWVEVGNPSARKIHKASKIAETVKIYTYKDPQVLMNELQSETVHRKEDLEIFSIPSSFLDRVESHVQKENRWSVINVDGTLMINGEDFAEQSEIKRHYFS